MYPEVSGNPALNRPIAFLKPPARECVPGSLQWLLHNCVCCVEDNFHCSRSGFVIFSIKSSVSPTEVKHVPLFETKPLRSVVGISAFPFPVNNEQQHWLFAFPCQDRSTLHHRCQEVYKLISFSKAFLILGPVNECKSSISSTSIRWRCPRAIFLPVALLNTIISETYAIKLQTSPHTPDSSIAGWLLLLW